MNPEEKQLLRESILRQCAAGREVGLPLGTIQRGLIIAGFARLTTDQVEAELHYLTSKGLLERKQAELSAGLGRWCTTAAGIEHLEAAGLL